MPDLTWEQSFAFVSAFLISAGTFYQLVTKLWGPSDPESAKRREAIAGPIAEATLGLTKEVEGLRRDMDDVRERVKLMNETLIKVLGRDT